MKKLHNKIAALVTTLSLVLNVSGTAYAANELVITGNGADSNSDVQLSTENNTSVVQNNDAKVTNSISIVGDTGSNRLNKNTGGMVRTITGDALSGVQVSNMLNSNSAEVGCCEGGDTEVLVDGNGADTTNNARVRDSRNTEMFQINNSEVKNDVETELSTGDNTASKNTGGDVVTLTGDAESVVMLETTGNSNTATMGGNNGDAGSVGARIVGNGADSKNRVNLDLNRDVLLTQFNDARVLNKVGTALVTGDNRTNKNTGGEVHVETGDAYGYVEVENSLNFNHADIDCGCIMDVMAKVGENGADTDNRIGATLSDDLNVFQDNGCGEDYQPSHFDMFRRGGRHHQDECMTNAIDLGLATGTNAANANTGDSMSDPAVWTGDAEGVVIVENLGNTNSFGQNSGSNGINIPTNGFNLHLNINLAQLLAALGVTN
jgi:hypothetical protein